jgi:hypothetical protein
MGQTAPFGISLLELKVVEFELDGLPATANARDFCFEHRSRPCRPDSRQARTGHPHARTNSPSAKTA